MPLGRFDKENNEKPTYAIVGESIDALTFNTPVFDFWNNNKVLCELLIKVILTFAIDMDFGFLLCTDPYYYLDEHTDDYSAWYVKYKERGGVREPNVINCSYKKNYQ